MPVDTPVYTDAALRQQQELANRTYTPSPKLPYIGSFSAEDEPYDPTDYPTVRKKIQDNILKAVQDRFPLESDKYVLSLENLKYADDKINRAAEKEALMQGKTLGTRLRGDWVLYDKTSGQEVDRKQKTLINVPYMTDRGTFIRNGSEHGLRNMFRLRSGIYTRIKGDGMIAAHVNPEQGTGRQGSLLMDPEKGVFTLKLGTKNYGLLPLLEAAGADPAEIEKAWGKELFDNNYHKYANILTGSDRKTRDEYLALWADKLSKYQFDPDTTAKTLGSSFKTMEPKALLAATSKMLKVAQTMDESETDDRDGLQFQHVLGAADYIPERIVRDGGGLFRGLLTQIDKDGNLSKVDTGMFQPHVDSVFTEDKHAGYIDGASPADATDFTTSISRLGEGGIGDTRAAPDESRGVSNSYAGFIDPIRSPESGSVGLQVFLSYGVKKDSRGNLYNKMIPKGSTTPVYVDMTTAASGNVAMPEFFDPKADPEEFIPAFRQGKNLDYIQRKDIDFYIADSSRLMSENSAMLPGLGGIRSNRTLMASKYLNQALPLESREAPLVQRKLITDDDGETTAEAHYGKKMGAFFAKGDGVVLDVDQDSITYQTADGEKHSVELYNNFPANQKGWLQSTPEVKPGDKITAGQCIASSNYTNKQGHAALGKNLTTAIVTGRNASTFADAIEISESAAKALASEQFYKTKAPMTPDMEYNKERFMALFGGKEFSPEQLDKLDDRGIVKPGQVLQKGDPIIVGIQQRDPSIRGISKRSSVPHIEVWEHDYPGTVTDVAQSTKAAVVYTKGYTPMQVGDKMCYDEKTEVLTDSGWKLFKDVKDSDLIFTLDTVTAHSFFTDFSKAWSFDHSGYLYAYESEQVSLRLTYEHNHIVAASDCPEYIRSEKAIELYHKRYYHITGEDIRFPQSYSPSDHVTAREGKLLYHGKVYCLEIPETHTMYTRRNGKCCWSGNSHRYGGKGIVSKVKPDDERLLMPDGTPIDIQLPPTGLPSRVNPYQLSELKLSQVAAKTGEPVVVPDFSTDAINEYTLKELEKHGIPESYDLTDPTTGKTIPDVAAGQMFYYKLKHLGEGKQSARGTGDYTMEELPLKGGYGGSRRYGSMEVGAVYSHTGLDSDVMKDSKLVRGQRNDDFWKKFRDGDYPSNPDIPMVHKKFFAHLQAAGINLRDDGPTIHMYGATDKNIKDMTQGRQVVSSGTYDSKQLKPVDGGLFDPKVFGDRGDQWGYYELPEPVLNPLMRKPVAALLGWKDRELTDVLEGKRSFENKTGPDALVAAIGKVDLQKSLDNAKQLLKRSDITINKRDAARKLYAAVYPMLNEGVKPQDFLLTRIPILPPLLRPVSIMPNDVNIVADSNYTYKQMIDSGEDFRKAQEYLTDENLLDARKQLYNSVEAAIGTASPNDRKLSDKGVEGVLKWAFGKSSPKYGSFQRKVLGAYMDTGGRGVVIPDSRINIDQMGINEDTAWDAYEPFVVRKLRQSGFTMADAVKNVLDRTPEARQKLQQALKERPLLFNRAPTLHKWNVQAHYPVIGEGKALRANPAYAGVYNLDHDGDTMNFHVPVSQAAVRQAIEKMLPSRNLLSASNMKAHIKPVEEFAQGLYLATRQSPQYDKKPIKRFNSAAEMRRALEQGLIAWDDPVDIPEE